MPCLRFSMNLSTFTIRLDLFIKINFKKKKNELVSAMFIKKAFSALALFALCACGDRIPAKTNVLSKPPASNNNKVTKPKQTTPKQNQTVFTKPEQITRNNNNKKEEGSPEATNLNIDRPEIVYKDGPGTFGSSYNTVYRSSGWFLQKADSLQRAYSVSDYNNNIQTIIDQISAVPNNGKNPAVNSSKWYAAIDFNIRKPNFVIIHHTAQESASQTLFTFSVRRSLGSSAHYVIGRDGIVYQMLNDYVRSWHAGNSKWGSITDMNSCSLGIELDNNGTTDKFSDAQIDALLKLLVFLKKEYGIPQANFIGHCDVAPGRKQDPSKYFPWKRLADNGFGYWYDPYNLPTPPADFNPMMALRLIGYDLKNPTEAIGAFKLHYIQTDLSKTLTDYDKKVLYSIYKKYM